MLACSSMICNANCHSSIESAIKTISSANNKPATRRPSGVSYSVGSTESQLLGEEEDDEGEGREEEERVCWCDEATLTPKPRRRHSFTTPDKKTEKRRGESTDPCWTPMLDQKSRDARPLMITRDRTNLYILSITRHIFPCSPTSSSRSNIPSHVICFR